MGNRLFGTAAAMVPQAGMSGVATIAPMVVAAVLENANIININYNDVVQSLPSNNTIARLVIGNAADTVMLTKISIKNNPVVYLSCDKGNKKGNKNLAKYLCWYCVKSNRVKTDLVDVDCTNENSKDIAKDVHHSLKRIFGENVAAVLYGQCTDSSGGRIR